jgi:quercetin dioxygenase-like cupin family protein
MRTWPSKLAALPPWHGALLIGALAVLRLGLDGTLMQAVQSYYAFQTDHAGQVALPFILCSNVAGTSTASPRPTSVVTVIQSEPLTDMPGKRITTLLVHYPPRAATPKHTHGGAVTAYVLTGQVRSQLNAGPMGEFHQGDMFYEPVGTIHTFIENPSSDEPAELLATIVHDEGATLTTLLE